MMSRRAPRPYAPSADSADAKRQIQLSDMAPAVTLRIEVTSDATVRAHIEFDDAAAKQPLPTTPYVETPAPLVIREVDMLLGAAAMARDRMQFWFGQKRAAIQQKRNLVESQLLETRAQLRQHSATQVARAGELAAKVGGAGAAAGNLIRQHSRPLGELGAAQIAKAHDLANRTLADPRTQHVAKKINEGVEATRVAGATAYVSANSAVSKASTAAPVLARKMSAGAGEMAVKVPKAPRPSPGPPPYRRPTPLQVSDGAGVVANTLVSVASAAYDEASDFASIQRF